MAEIFQKKRLRVFISVTGDFFNVSFLMLTLLPLHIILKVDLSDLVVIFLGFQSFSDFLQVLIWGNLSNFCIHFLYIFFIFFLILHFNELRIGPVYPRFFLLDMQVAWLQDLMKCFWVQFKNSHLNFLTEIYLIDSILLVMRKK